MYSICIRVCLPTCTLAVSVYCVQLSSLSLALALSLPLSLSLSLSMSLSLSLSLFLSPFLSLSLSISITVCFCLCSCPGPFLHVSISISVSVSILVLASVSVTFSNLSSIPSFSCPLSASVPLISVSQFSLTPLSTFLLGIFSASISLLLSTCQRTFKSPKQHRVHTIHSRTFHVHMLRMCWDGRGRNMKQRLSLSLL